MVVVKEELNFFGMTSFNNLDDQEIMVLNFNIKSKMVQQFAVMVKESPEVTSKISALESRHKDSFNEIKLKLENGEDVNPFLSKQAIRPKFQDFLLLDWNIHHFHLNNLNSGGYFNDRSDYLLMVLFKNGFAHFIDIEHHNDNEVFVKREYLKIIKDNWPEIITSYELKGALDVSFNPTNDEIKKLRKNQINTCLKIDDKVYAPIGGGITTAGTGVNHITKAIKWKKYIESVEEKYQKNKSNVLNDIYTKTGKSYSDLDLDFDYHNNHLVLVDKNSNLIIESMNA